MPAEKLISNFCQIPHLTLGVFNQCKRGVFGLVFYKKPLIGSQVQKISLNSRSVNRTQLPI